MNSSRATATKREERERAKRQRKDDLDSFFSVNSLNVDVVNSKQTRMRNDERERM